jgi:HKD family nuclease
MHHRVITQGIDGDSIEKELVGLLSDDSIIGCRILVAFVTLDGLLKLGSASGGSLRESMRSPGKRFKLIVGVDSVTTADALSEIRRLSAIPTSDFQAKAFSSSERRLFHPKVYIFDRRAGSSTILVGSSNLTASGLSENIEVSIRLDDLSGAEMEQWDQLWDSFWTNRDTKEIDGNLVSDVRNKRESERRERRGRRRAEPAEVELPVASPQILVRVIPFAKGRTSQVHFTKQIVEDFFGLDIEKGGSLRVQQVQPSQEPQPIEERNLVYSKKSNRNPKIELTGARVLDESYPTGNKRPMIIMERIAPHSYRYMLLLPGDAGYREVSRASGLQPRGQALAYWITDLDSLLEVWSAYPH